MKCPNCKQEVKFGEPYMPFCSERCKLIDLGDWAAEKHVISSPIFLYPDQDPEPDDRQS